MKLGLKDKESRAVTIVTYTDAEEIVRTFRIDWKDGYQFEEWATMSEMRQHHIYVASDERQPNTVLHTTNTAKEMDVRYYSVASNIVDWWIAQADDKFPVYLDRPGRPVKRALELLTTRQRRLASRPPL